MKDRTGSRQVLVLCPFLLVAVIRRHGTGDASHVGARRSELQLRRPDALLISRARPATYTGEVVTFYDRTGTPVRAQQRLHETDVFTAGRLVGQENTLQSITFVNGQPDTLTVHGLLFTHVRLPGGGIFGQRRPRGARHQRQRRQLPRHAHDRTASQARRLLRRAPIIIKN